MRSKRVTSAIRSLEQTKMPLLVIRAFLLLLLVISCLPPSSRANAEGDPDFFPAALRDAVITVSEGISGEGRNFFGLDTDFSPNGSGIDPANGYLFDAPNATVTVDLKEIRPLHALFLQSESDDTIILEGSKDGVQWRILWFAPPVEGSGLQTRAVELQAPTPLRWLRLRAGTGNPPIVVTRLAVYDRLPPPGWDTGVGKLRAPGPTWTVTRLSLIVAIVGLITVLISCGASWLTPSPSARRAADILLGALAVLGVLLFFKIPQVGFSHPIHYWDILHYYLGAKYQVELRYDGLYECLLIADKEAGYEARLSTETIRDLKTNVVVSTTPVLLEPERCLDRFTPNRWREFREDARWFRSKIDYQRWILMRNDHGFNGSPVWLIVPTILTRALPLNDATIWLFTMLDDILIIAMWAAAGWAFGWRGVSAGIIFWGTNGIADPGWTSGAFLRYDWLFFTVLSLALVRKNHCALGGVALGVASLLRVFPGFIAMGLGFRLLAIAWQEHRLDQAILRFFMGMIVATVVLLPISYGVVGSPTIFTDFIRNSQKHLDSPATNLIGLRLVVARSEENRPELLRVPGSVDEFEAWRSTERRALAEGRNLYLVTATLFITLLFIAAIRISDQAVLLILSIGTLPFLLTLSNYYYVILLAFGLLWGAVAEAPALLIGLGLVATIIEGSNGSAVWAERSQMVLIFVLLVSLLAVVRMGRSVPKGSDNS